MRWLITIRAGLIGIAVATSVYVGSTAANADGCKPRPHGEPWRNPVEWKNDCAKSLGDLFEGAREGARGAIVDPIVDGAKSVRKSYDDWEAKRREDALIQEKIDRVDWDAWRRDNERKYLELERDCVAKG